TNELDDVLELSLLLEDFERLAAEAGPVLPDVRNVPAAQVVGVERVAVEPIDRREVPPRSEARVECPEDPRHAKGVLRDGVREVTPGRGDRTDHRDRACPLIWAQDYGPAGPFVELCEPPPEVGGVALLAGHLLEPA